LINGKLLKDIDLGGIDNEGNGVAENEWTAIKGSVDYPFGGTFDGDGHVISGLYINQSDSNYQGLFGYIESATIKNLGVSGSVTGKLHIGGIVGSMNSSVVSNCYNACSVDGSVSVGGIIGYSYSSSVKNCYNIGSVVAIEIAGGVVGEAIYGSISYCYNIGAVKEEDVYLDNTGGILGYWSSSDTNYFEISYCYYDKDVVTDVNGAAYGKDDGTNYCGLSTEMMQGDATTEGSLLYYLTNENYGNSSDWTADTENINNGYPILVEN
ncbi:MAG: GLUG motif-containing protein, partial [Rikenellaceae bacterium]